MSMALQSTRTLLLSNAYEPIQAISLKRAMTLLFNGKVEVIEEYDWNIVPVPSEIQTDVQVTHGNERRTVKRTMIVFKAPAVVRLLTAFIRRRRPIKFSRVNIYARDRYTCQYCGTKRTLAELTFDHVIPRKLGGKTTWTNIATSCGTCNLKKGGRTPEQAGMKLLKQPVQPTWQSAIAVTVSSTSVPDAWRDYLYWTGELENDNS
jgi:5-methylcytosine-specific restriction endonuclease McrA